MKRLILFSAIVALNIGCAKQKALEDTYSVSPEEAAVESAMSALSGASDEQAGESYAVVRSSSENMFAAVQNLILPQAHASMFCDRAIFQACSLGVREATYNSCSPGGRTASLNGYVRLTYSQSNCSFNAGDSVIRSYDLELAGPRGGVATVSSAVQADYRGTSYGGGGKLTRTAGGYDVDVLGKHIVLNFRGRPLYNVSVRTLSPIGLTGTLNRSNRLADGGQLEVNHNLAGFTALFQPHNLQWTSGCCHPVSGTLDVQWAGSKTGSAQVTFNSCGSASYSDGVQSNDLTLSYCE